jgi:hypothetical protein
MKHKVTVIVTADHINAGTQRVGAACPIALSLIDMGYTGVHVARDYLLLKESGHTIKLPDHVAVFTRDYDEGVRVDPFSFEIELPCLP